MRLINSLTFRLVSTLLLAAAIYGGAASYSSYLNALHESSELFDSQLDQMTQDLLAIGAFADDKHPADASRLDQQLQQALHFELWREQGGELKVLLRSRDEGIEFPFFQDIPEGYSEHVIGRQRWRVYRQRQAEKGLDSLVAQKDDALHELARKIAWNDIAPFLYGLPLLGLAACLLVFIGLRPLRRLARELESRSPDELTPLDLASLPNEMQPPAAAMNRLMLDLARALEHERRFTSDAAHELRTPLAALCAQLDNARHATDAMDEQLASLDKAMLAARRLQHLVTQLLILCRLDISAHLERTPVMLDEVTETACADLAPNVLAKNIDISLNAVPARFAGGNRELLYVLLRNLVDNAIRYTPFGGKVAVSIREADGGWLLRVADSGGGVAKDELGLLGKRFRRLAPSQAEGVGLGLSIVVRIAELHDASVTFTLDAVLGGLCVDVFFHDLPLADSGRRV